MYRILVTGGAGFIGSHLVWALCKRGHAVTVYDSLLPQVHGPSPAVEMPRGASLVRADIRDKQRLACAVADADVVYHLAALTGVGQSMYEIVDYADVNCVGTANLLECIVERARPLSRFVLASSRAVYGEGKYYCDGCDRAVYPAGRDARRLAEAIWDPLCPFCEGQLRAVPVDEECAPRPGSVYAVSKLTQDKLCEQVCLAYEIPYVVLRYYNVYGRGQSLANPYTGVLSVFASILANGGVVEVYEDGNESRDFVHVLDVVQACITSINGSVASGVYNIGSGAAVTILEVATQLTGLLDGRREPILTGRYRVGDVRHCVADISKARRLLSYEPTVSIPDGLVQFVEWVRQQDAAPNGLYKRARSELAKRGLYK